MLVYKLDYSRQAWSLDTYSIQYISSLCLHLFADALVSCQEATQSKLAQPHVQAMNLFLTQMSTISSEVITTAQASSKYELAKQSSSSKPGLDRSQILSFSPFGSSSWILFRLLAQNLFMKKKLISEQDINQILQFNQVMSSSSVALRSISVKVPPVSFIANPISKIILWLYSYWVILTYFYSYQKTD